MQEVDQEIIKNAKVDLGLCFTRFLGGKIHDFHVFRNFLTFGPKSEKIEISTKMCTFGSKSEKICVFSRKSPKRALFRSFRAPCENVALAQGILMVLGALFAFWSEKC